SVTDNGNDLTLGRQHVFFNDCVAHQVTWDHAAVNLGVGEHTLCFYPVDQAGNTPADGVCRQFTLSGAP
ncbi:hypothetical protein COY28_03970, partial [Candidatus Woesearchaeota archaeon CG_4_10_14_0_2_um_filter_57_5]